MNKPKIIEPLGFIISGLSLIVTLSLFFYDSADFNYSLAAAIMASLIVWSSYIVLRWIYLAIKE